MKENIHRLAKTTFTALILLAACAAFAQDAATSPSPSTADAILAPLLGKYSGVAATVLMIVGILRLIVKPVITIVEVVVSATPSKSDDEAFAKIQQGPVMKWVLYALDWLASIKAPNTNTNPITK